MGWFLTTDDAPAIEYRLRRPRDPGVVANGEEKASRV